MLHHRVWQNFSKDVLSVYNKWAATWENRIFAYAKTMTQISFAVIAKLTSALIFATWMVHFLFFLNPKFQAVNYLLWLRSPVCVGPGRISRKPVFSQRGSNVNVYDYAMFNPFIKAKFCFIDLSIFSDRKIIHIRGRHTWECCDENERSLPNVYHLVVSSSLR